MTFKLFAVLLGGRATGAHIELHDIVFTVGETLQSKYPQLIHQWFGETKGVHVDSSAELNVVDGYEICISNKPSDEKDPPSLFFINFGGYKPGVFGELHEMGFYVAHNKKKVVARAKNELLVGQHQQHRDDIHAIDVDDFIEIKHVETHHIVLKAINKPNNIIIESSYRRLDVANVLTQADKLEA